MMEVHIVESNLVEGHFIVDTIFWTYHCFLFVIRLINFVMIRTLPLPGRFQPGQISDF